MRADSLTELERLAGGEEEGDDAEEEGGGFELHGGAMEAVELAAQGIFRRRGVDGAHLAAQSGHARADAKFGGEGEREHQHNENRGRRDQESGGFREREARDEIQQSGDHSDVMQARERVAHHAAGLVAIREYAEDARRLDKAEEDDAANPGAESEELEEAKDGSHEGRLSQVG